MLDSLRLTAHTIFRCLDCINKRGKTNARGKIGGRKGGGLNLEKKVMEMERMPFGEVDEFFFKTDNYSVLRIKNGFGKPPQQKQAPSRVMSVEIRVDF